MEVGDRHAQWIRWVMAHARPQEREQLVGGPVDVAGAEQQDEVAGAHDLEQRVGEPLAARHEAHVEVAAALERLEERLAA